MSRNILPDLVLYFEMFKVLINAHDKHTKLINYLTHLIYMYEYLRGDSIFKYKKFYKFLKSSIAMYFGLYDSKTLDN